MTYLLISLPFLLLALVLWIVRRHSAPRQLAVTAIIMVVLLVLARLLQPPAMSRGDQVDGLDARVRLWKLMAEPQPLEAARKGR